MAAETTRSDLVPNQSPFNAPNRIPSREARLDRHPPLPASPVLPRERPATGRRQPPNPAQLAALVQELSTNRAELLEHAIDLVRRGRRYRGDLPGSVQAEDLLQEAALLLTRGSRTWADHIEPRVLLKMAIKQLAGHQWRGLASREVSLDRSIEGPTEIDREESESDRDTVDLMKGGGSDFAWMDSDDEEVPHTGEVPELDPSNPHRFGPEELYSLREREQVILTQVDSALSDDEEGKAVVRSILNRHLKRREIARDLGVATAKIDFALRRLKRKLLRFVPQWKEWREP